MPKSTLYSPIQMLSGLGPRKSEILQKELGVRTFFDLLQKFPFRYIDKTIIQQISDLGNSEDYVQIIGRVVSKNLVKGKFKKRLVVKIEDKTGRLELVWFQGVAWVEKSIVIGQAYLFYGKINGFKGKLNITHPDFELATDKKRLKGALDPIYSSTEKLNANGLGQKQRKKMIEEIFRLVPPSQFVENIGLEYRQKLSIISKYESLRLIHFPNHVDEKEAAEKRLKFEELFFLQLKILFQKGLRKGKVKGIVFPEIGEKFHHYYKTKIPFELTRAQKRVIKEIRQDMGSGFQLNRLLQGDVGSGKTMVAILTMLIAIDNGYQCCLMAPTEILARQHFDSIQESMKGTGIHVAFLSGSIKGKKRQETLGLLKEGLIHILIGTHALIEKWVEFKNFGLAIIDEQHRFGVAQRAKLWQKSKDRIPHILVMTATPIPRTMALTVYGDLDTSVIDELPPGRKPIKTIHQYENKRIELYKFIDSEIKKGRQAYIVYPLIEESSTLDLQNLQDGYDRLLHVFPRPDFQISVVHGRMKAADKAAEMERFVKGETHIMVATTVIEVGVNVPNASVMVIENAERFGLSQLHQLRGRVGRGADKAYCILMTSFKVSKEGKERLSTMVRTNDGFEIAEVDLKLRGPGDIEGTQQSGILELKLANIVKDQSLLMYSRTFATNILRDDPSLEKEQNKPFLDYLKTMKSFQKDWGRIS